MQLRHIHCRAMEPGCQLRNEFFIRKPTHLLQHFEQVRPILGTLGTGRIDQLRGNVGHGETLLSY